MSVFQSVLLVLSLLLTAPLGAQEAGQVVVYTALDRQFSEPLLKDFEKSSGIRVLPVYDTEAVKTVGLVNRLLAERERPRADVFWNNEILRSIQLKEEGLTAPYASPSAADIPEAMKDKDGHWAGFAARARVILVNKNLITSPEEYPRRVEELTAARWKDRASFAKPLFGTTNTHAAIVWSQAGPDAAKQFWTSVMDNAVMQAGNAQARDAVARGESAWCLTDTDDAHGAIVDNAPVEMIFPDGGPAGEGTILIPNTVVLIKGSPNQGNGKKLIDFLLSREVEARLAQSRSAQIPVRPGIPGPSRMPPLAELKTMKVDWQKAYEAIAPSSGWLAETIANR